MCFHLLTWLFECFKGLHLWTYPFIQLCNHFGSQSIVNFMGASPMFNRFLHDLEAQPLKWAGAKRYPSSHSQFVWMFLPPVGSSSVSSRPSSPSGCMPSAWVPRFWTKLLRCEGWSKLGHAQKWFTCWEIYIWWTVAYICGLYAVKKAIFAGHPNISVCSIYGGFWLAMCSGSGQLGSIPPFPIVMLCYCWLRTCLNLI